jgi:pimeloyl-ACP methyl ester carboxylesterase
MSLRRVLLAAVGVLALVAGAGCTRGGGPTPNPSGSADVTASPAATLPPVGAQCRELALQGLTVRLENSAGLRLAAVDLGSGPMGVVLAHQSDASMCQWLPYATTLANLGYRVVAFDFAGFGASSPAPEKTYVEDIRTVVDYLRDRGTSQVVVIGASMGATMSVVAASAISPPLSGVVAISPPATFDEIDAEVAAPSLNCPALYVASTDDGDYVVYASALNDATPEPLRDLLVVDSPEHGVELVGAQTSAGAQVRAQIAEFLRERLQPTATPTS